MEACPWRKPTECIAKIEEMHKEKWDEVLHGKVTKELLKKINQLELLHPVVEKNILLKKI